MKAELSLDTLREVTARVLEEASFVFTEPVDDGSFPAGDVLETTLAFGGPDPDRDSGRLVFAATPAFSIDLAANLLGIEPDDPDAADKGRDGLKELLNMIGGVLMSEWFGADAICSLGIPDAAVVSREEHEERRARASWSGALITEEEARLDLSVEAD
ncbi:MAG: hypothetical protein JW958_00855 [Candidatus Eisenbacteria bacterium]|nr:hypothetical protein [Candidatus Eisenbacteria bacterium]